MQVIAETPADAFAVLDALGPRGVWFTVSENFATVAEANAFLTAIEQRSRG